MRASNLSLIMALVAPVFGWSTPSSGTVLTGSQTLDGSGSTIEGNNSTGYFVQSGELDISNVTLRNFKTTGAAGSGGGAGLGGAIFVNNEATVNLDNVTFNANTAVGGNGGSGSVGGKLNNLLTASSNGSSGTNGDNAPSNTGNTNSGNGRAGYNGLAGGNASNGFGGSGGNGGNGDGGSSSIIESALVDAITGAIGVKSAYDAIAGTALTADLAALEVASAAVVASGADILVIPVAESAGAAFEAAGVALGEIESMLVSADVLNAAVATAQTSYQTYKTVTAYHNDGVAGIGGNGGNGAKGGNGSFGFGGGKGGDGGAGGNAVSGSIASGGIGGSGGNGGQGGFGAGGGRGGNGGSGGSNGTYSSVSNGSLIGTAGNGGLAGFGGGTGSNANGTSDGTGGTGGAGYGGAIFVSSGGTLNINGPVVFNKNAVQGGSSLNNGPAGDMAGTDLFMMKGSTITINPGSGHTVTFNGTIADDSAESISTATYSSGQGAGLTIQSGLVQFNGANTYTGQTALHGGVLQALDGQGVNTNSNINIAGGVFESSGTFNRYLGTGSDRLQWTGSGGFSASGGDLLVDLNDDETLTWNSGSFVPSGSNLVFGSNTATNNVTLINNINLNSGSRTILATASDEVTNEAILTGVISNGSLTIGGESYTGVVRMTGGNTYTGPTHVAGGTVILDGSFQSGTVGIDGGATFQDTNGGLCDSTILTVNGTLDVLSNETVGTLFGAGTINLESNNLEETTNYASFTLSAGFFSGGITGDNASNGLTKVTSSALTLTGSNTYVGTTQINEGTLTLSGSGSLASQVVNVALGSTLSDSNGGLSSTCALTNAGTVTLGANDTVGSLTCTGTIGGSDYTLTAATYDFDNSATVDANLGEGVLTSNGSLLLDGTSQAGTINIPTGVMTFGSGSRLLNTPNVTVNGELVLGGSETITALTGSNTGQVSIQYGALTASSGSFAGCILGTNTSYGLTKVSDGTLTLSGTNTYTGTTQISAGILDLTGNLASRIVHVSSGATLSDENSGLNSSSALTNAGTVVLGANDTVGSLSNTGTINGSEYTLTATTYALNDGSVVNANLGAGTLTTTGSVELNGTSSAATVNISSGTTTLGSAERLLDSSTVTVYGELILGGNEKISVLNGNGSVSVENGTLTVDSGSFSGEILGTDTDYGLHKVSEGTFSLTGTNSYVGTTQIDEGTLSLTGSGTLASLIVNVASGATLDDTNGALAAGAALSNDGTVVLGADDTVTSFSNTGELDGEYTLTAETYALNEGSVINANLGTGAITSNGVVNLNGTSSASTLDVATGTMTLGSAGRLLSTPDVTLNGSLISSGEVIGTLTGSETGSFVLSTGSLTVNGGDFSGVISGSHFCSSVNKVSEDTLILSGDNTYTASTHVEAGILSLVGSLQSQSITIDSGATFQDQNGGMHDNTSLGLNGSLVLNANDTIAILTGEGTVNLYGGSLTLNSGDYSGFITGTNEDYGLIKNNDGEFVFSGEGTYVGPTQVNAGTFTLSGALSSEVLNVATGATFHDGDSGLLPTLVATIDGTLELTNGDAIDTLNGSGLVSLVDSILTLNQGSFSGVISGSGGVTKTSSDSLTLSGTNTYTGATEVNAGTLVLTGSLESATVNIATDASLVDTDGGLGSSLALTNSGTLVLGADNTIGSLVNSGTIMGENSLTAETYALNDGSTVYANLGTGTITTNGAVQLHGTSAASVVNIEAESELDLMGEQLLLDSVTVNVTGVLSLNGGNQVINHLNGTGDVNVNTYALTVNNGGDFTGQLNASGTPLTAQGGTLNLTNNTVNTDSIALNTGASINLSGSTATTNDLVVSGTSVLSVASTSNLTVNGNVQVQDSGSVTIDPNSSLSAQMITTAADSVIHVPDSSTLSYTTLNGSGTINTAGNVFTNQNYVHGFISFTNDFTNTGTFHPGNSPGLITIGGNYTESGTLAVDLETTTPVTGHSQVQVGGSVTLSPGSILNVRTYGGVFPTRGNVYQIIADSSGDPLRVNGTFTTVEFDRDGEVGIAPPVVNAAVVFDVATGQVVATGLNDVGSVYADLGSNENERRAAKALFKGAEVGPYQIDTDTLMGTLVDQILDSSAGTDVDLAYYTPDYYGGMTDLAFMGDRSLIRQVLNRVSPMNDPSNDSFANHGAFAGYIQNNSENADNVDLTRRDYFVGGDLTNGSDFSAGLVASKVSGGMRASLGKSDADGAASLIYARKALGNFTTFATVGYSAQNHKLHRPTMNGKVEATTTVNAWTGSVSLQYKGLTLGEFSITPRGSLVYSQARVNSFTERGAVDALYNKGYNSNILTGELGASALYSTKLWNRVFNVEILAGVEQTLGNAESKMDLHLVEEDAVRYDMNFAKTKLIRATYGLNIGYNLFDSTQLNLGYEASSGSGCDQSFNVAIRLSI